MAQRNNIFDSALIAKCDCVCWTRASNLGLTLNEIDCSRQLPDSCLSVVGDTVLITSTHCRALFEDDNSFSCLSLQPPKSHHTHTHTMHEHNHHQLAGLFLICLAVWGQEPFMHLAGRQAAVLWLTCQHRKFHPSSVFTGTIIVLV